MSSDGVDIEHAPLREIERTFREVDDETRLAVLLDYSERLPALPEELAARRDAGENRVPECMTPVFMWVVPDEDAGDGGGPGGSADPAVRLFVDVGEEAPTVRGILSVIVSAYDGERASTLAALPTDLLRRLGLLQHLRMNRAMGLDAIIGRFRRAGASLAPGG